ncbi:MAG: threonine ammonia-lyase, partial [Paramuribaculum sp.]|nr:threonine ammonia-lyase [Paramuribaculum sp.]
VAEGAGATPLAAVLFHKLPIKGKKVVCLVSGGNIDVTSLNRVIARGLVKSGRDCNLVVQTADKPGQLAEICTIIGQLGGNIMSVKHDRVDTGNNINGCRLLIEIETRNMQHVKEIKQALREAGFGVD